MATKEHWEVDPWNDEELMQRVVGGTSINIEEDEANEKMIFHEAYGLRCLEIGAGYGRWLKKANKTFFQCFGVDSSLSMVGRSTHFLRFEPHCRVVLNNGILFPFSQGYFDFVYSFTCFQHMPDLEIIRSNLLESFRVLGRGKKCRIQTVCGNRNEPGRYDGYVFENAVEFAQEFDRVGFRNVQAMTFGEWIWAEGEK